MRKSILAFAGATALLSTAALADGMPSKGGACCAPASPWTGFYIGAGVGAASVVHDISAFGASLDGIGGEGVFGTVIAGYDRQISQRMVAGIFTDFDFSNVSTDLSAGPLIGSAEHKHSWSVGGRLGLLSSPTTLWYGMAGYTQAEFEINSNLGSVSVPDFSGYFVGGGVESQLQGGWGLRAEYRFSQFDQETIADIVGVEPSMHSARLALTYKWGREDVGSSPMK